MFSFADKALKATSAVQQKTADSNSFFRKAGKESFFGAKDTPTFFGKPVQAKLTVSTPDDPQEKEADAVADKVMRMSSAQTLADPLNRLTGNSVQKKCAACEAEEKQQHKEEKEEEVQAKSDSSLVSKIDCSEEHQDELQASLNPVINRKAQGHGRAKAQQGAGVNSRLINKKNISLSHSDIMRQGERGPPLSSGPFEQSLASSKGGGNALPDDTRQHMESRFNADFSGVRIHTGTAATELTSGVQAKAFAHGNDIYFNSGQFSPHTVEGGTLLAHELTHTLQQGASATKSNDNTISRKCSHCEHGENQVQLKEQAPAALPLEPPTQNEAPTKPKQPAGIPMSDPPGPSSQSKKDPAQTEAQGNSNTASDPTPAATPVKSDNKNGNAQGLPKPGATNSGSKEGSNQPALANKKSQGRGEPPVGAKDAQRGNAPAPEAQLDSNSSDGLLESIATVPASSFISAVNKSKSLSGQVQSQEKADMEAKFPEVEQPTGLPRVAGQNQVATTLPAGKVPDLNNAGERTGPEPELKHQDPEGPLPASNVSTAVPAAPADDQGGGWWNWLTNLVKKFLGSIPTHDDGLSTSAGARPNVDLSGDADPGQTNRNQEESEQEVASQQTTADQATTADFGENNIYPTVPVKRLKTRYKAAAPIAAKAGVADKAPEIPVDMRASFDEHKTPELNMEAAEKMGQYKQDEDKYHQDSELTHQQGMQQIADETAKTRNQQQGMQQQAKQQVSEQRESWKQENKKIKDEYATKSEEKRNEIDGQIKDKVQSTEKQADQKLTEAETKADNERQKTEQEAAQKKKEADEKPHSWWDSVKDAVSSVFDALKKVVDGLFDALRALVKDIIEAAKAVVHGIIEAARAIVVGLIKAFGEFVKGLVSIALAAFPALAAKARAWIDGHVDQAVAAVNAAADALEHAVDAILDWVGRTIDKALSVLQSAWDFILDALEFLTRGLIEIIRLLFNLDELIKKVGGFINGLTDLMNNPGKIEAAAKETVKGYIDQIPGKTKSKIEEYLQKEQAPAPKSADPVIQKKDDPAAAKNESGLMKHLKGIWRHLEPGLEHIEANWWTEIKQMLWNLVWPFNDKSPLKKDATELYHLPGKILDSIWDHKFSQAVDQYLLMQQKLNSVIGLFYGWFFIASVLVGAVVGSIVPGPGTLAGAAAGAAFAGEVGEGLLLAMIAAETEVILKGVYDLAFGPGTVAVNESAYDRIANSGLTLGITAVFMELSEIASEIASELISGIKGIFKGDVPEVPGAKVEAPEAKGDTPETKGDTPEVKDLGTEGGKKVVGEAEGEGGKAKVLEDGSCLVCTTCEEISIRYKDELNGSGPDIDKIKTELDEARANGDPDAKAKAIEDLRERLDKIRDEIREGEPTSVKMDALDTAAKEARNALETAKENFRGELADDLRADPAVKKDLEIREARVNELKREWDNLKPEADKAVEDGNHPDIASDPDLAKIARDEADALRDKLEDIRTEATQIKNKLDVELEEQAKVNEAKRAEEEKAASIDPDKRVADALESIDNKIRDTTPEGRPKAKIGDGTTEAVLDLESQTGKPEGYEPGEEGQGHYIKTGETINGLKGDLETLERFKSQIKDPDTLRAIDDAAARANDKMAKLQAALDVWNQRASARPDIWFPDGTSRVTPGWP